MNDPSSNASQIIQQRKSYRKKGEASLGRLTQASGITSDSAVSERGASQSAPSLDDDALDMIAELPRDVGWFLLLGGLLSEFGTLGVPPFWIVGILILWPRTGKRVAKILQRRSPKLFDGCLSMVNRYAQDLESKYPKRHPGIGVDLSWPRLNHPQCVSSRN